DGHVGIEPLVFTDKGDILSQGHVLVRVFDAVSEYVATALARVDHAEEHAKGSAFAGAVQSEKRGDAARLHVEVQVADRVRFAVTLAQIAGLNHWLRHRPVLEG